jgi:hypothetical protein
MGAQNAAGCLKDLTKSQALVAGALSRSGARPGDHPREMLRSDLT